MRVVAALGGNALLRRGEPPEADVQLAHLAEAVRGLAPLLDEHEVLITHGNGPQIGLLAIESAGDPGLSAPYPLDALDAQTQGMIGYWLMRELRRARPKREVAALLAERLDAYALLLLTDVPAVLYGYGTPGERPVTEATPAELRALGLPAGSMGPKAEAACRFAEHRPGGVAAIGALHDAAELLNGRAGTRVRAPHGRTR